LLRAGSLTYRTAGVPPAHLDSPRRAAGTAALLPVRLESLTYWTSSLAFPALFGKGVERRFTPQLRSSRRPALSNVEEVTMAGEAETEEDKLNGLLKSDSRFKREAYRFVQESLEFTRRKLTRRGHVTGRELAEGVRDLAVERFGLLAKTVLNEWGIRATGNIGDIVYNMIEAKIMVKQDSDSREDFEDVYDFEGTFQIEFKLEPDS
jgi:uncharacterized repeat protein (TIGR04138 family)